MLAPVLEWLGARGIVSLLVEGGPTLHAAFASEGLVDRVQLVVTPQALGDGVRARAGRERSRSSGHARAVDEDARATTC